MISDIIMANKNAVLGVVSIAAAAAVAVRIAADSSLVEHHVNCGTNVFGLKNLKNSQNSTRSSACFRTTRQQSEDRITTKYRQRCLLLYSQEYTWHDTIPHDHVGGR